MDRPPVVRTAEPSDDAGVRRVVVSAFGADEGDVIMRVVDDLAAGGLMRAPIVAVDGDEVVGYVALSHAWLDARERLVDVLVLSPLAVQPERQGSGLGTALVGAALDAARELRAPLVFLEGSPAYYGRRGFEKARDRGLRPASRRTPVAAFQVAVLNGWDERHTGALVYPDVWWRHDAAGLRDPALAELETTLGSWDD